MLHDISSLISLAFTFLRLVTKALNEAFSDLQTHYPHLDIYFKESTVSKVTVCTGSIQGGQQYNYQMGF